VMVMTGYTNAQIKDWSSIQKELADTSNDKLLNRITRTNLRSLDKQKVDHAAKLIKDHKEDQVMRKSRTAAIIFKWMSSVMHSFQFKSDSMKQGH